MKQWWWTNGYPRSLDGQGDFVSFAHRMRNWKEKRVSHSSVEMLSVWDLFCYFVTVACFLLLFISYALGEERSVFGSLNFIAEPSPVKHINQTFPPPHHLITWDLKHQKSNFQNCPEVLGVQKCWHVLSLLSLWASFLWRVQHGIITGTWPSRVLVIVTSPLLKWYWLESFCVKESHIFYHYESQVLGKIFQRTIKQKYQKRKNSWWSILQGRVGSNDLSKYYPRESVGILYRAIKYTFPWCCALPGTLECISLLLLHQVPSGKAPD